jgi:hypothetical protein
MKATMISLAGCMADIEFSHMILWMIFGDFNLTRYLITEVDGGDSNNMIFVQYCDPST